MNYLHYEFDAGPDDFIEVRLDKAANVMLMDGTNYEQYRRSGSTRYRGGYVTTSPYLLSPPSQGHWHLVIDLGGQSGTVHASARLIPRTVRVGASAG
jgi:hypothetical protein